MNTSTLRWILKNGPSFFDLFELIRTKGTGHNRSRQAPALTKTRTKTANYEKESREFVDNFGAAINRLVDENSDFEYRGEQPYKLIYCEQMEGARINQHEVLLGRNLEENIADNILETKLHEFKKLHQKCLLSEKAYLQIQISLSMRLSLPPKTDPDL